MNFGHFGVDWGDIIEFECGLEMGLPWFFGIYWMVRLLGSSTSKTFGLGGFIDWSLFLSLFDKINKFLIHCFYIYYDVRSQIRTLEIFLLPFTLFNL